MPSAQADRPRSSPATALAWALAFLFAASGCAGLILENIWFRQFGLVLGHSVWASGVVLASFMWGIAVGNVAAARWGDRGRRPLLAFAAAELLVSVTGAALVIVLPSVAAWLAPVQRALGAHPLAVNGVRLAVSFLLLSVPTTAMGLTLPLLVVTVTRRREEFGTILARLYGFNTLGAVAGCLLVETALVPRLGVRNSGLSAAGLDLAVAATGLLLARRYGTPSSARLQTIAEAGPVALDDRASLRILGAGFLTGAMLLALEVVWFRFLLLFASATSVGFAMMLALVLAGIGLGGVTVSLCLARGLRMRNYLPAVVFACGIATVASYVLFETTLRTLRTQWAVAPLDILSLAAPLLLPTSFLSGMVFTLLGAALSVGSVGNAKAAGQLTSANTLGAMAGSLLGAFVLLPALGVEGTLFTAAAGYGVAALLVPSPMGPRAPRWVARAAGAAFVALLVLFPHGLMWRYLAVPWTRIAHKEDMRVVAVREGVAETAAYLDHLRHGEVAYRRLVTNGFSMSSTRSRAQRYMRLYVYLPVALQARLRRALLISYGVGATASALTATRELEAIHVVDISRDVVELSRLNFPPASWPPADPRVHLHIEDGRQYLLTTSERFDLITAEPPPPKLAGVSSLYSLEFFRLVRDRLAPGGFVTYWLPLHQLTVDDFKVLVKTFCSAFEDCSLWAGADADWMLVGTREASGPVSDERLWRQWRDPQVGAELMRLGLENPARLGSLFLADAATLAPTLAGVPTLDDDHPGRLAPATRTYAGRLYLELLDRAPDTFEHSAWIARIWPRGSRRDVLREYRERRIEEDLFWGLQVPERRVQALPDAYHLLLETRLRDLPFRLLGGDPDLAAATQAHAQRGDVPAWVAEQLAADAFARRDFARASAFARQARHADPTSVTAWRLDVLAECLSGTPEAAAATLASAPRDAFDASDRQFLERTLPRRSEPPTLDVERAGSPAGQNAVQ